MAVTLRTTAATSVAGTPPRPVTWRSIDPPGPAGARGAPLPSRVSSRRNGVTPTNPPAAAGLRVAGALAAAVAGAASAADDQSATGTTDSADSAAAKRVRRIILRFLR